LFRIFVDIIRAFMMLKKSSLGNKYRKSWRVGDGGTITSTGRLLNGD
jgi:hypothetical protein